MTAPLDLDAPITECPVCGAPGESRQWEKRHVWECSNAGCYGTNSAEPLTVAALIESAGGPALVVRLRAALAEVATVKQREREMVARELDHLADQFYREVKGDTERSTAFNDAGSRAEHAAISWLRNGEEWPSFCGAEPQPSFEEWKTMPFRAHVCVFPLTPEDAPAKQEVSNG